MMNINIFILTLVFSSFGFVGAKTINISGISEKCVQDFYSNAPPSAAVSFSDGNRVANDIVVAAGGCFTIQTIVFEMASPSGNPASFDLEIFNDNGSGGIGTSTGFSQQFNRRNMSFVRNGQSFGMYRFTVTLRLNPVELDAENNKDTRFWIALTSGRSTTGKKTYWPSYRFTSNSNSFPSRLFSTTNGEWSNGAKPVEGFMRVEGECGRLEVPETIVNEFSFFPNPVKDILQIRSTIPAREVIIVNEIGRQVMTAPIIDGEVDVRKLDPGLYKFKTVLDNGQIETFRVVKNRNWFNQ